MQKRHSRELFLVVCSFSKFPISATSYRENFMELLVQPVIERRLSVINMSLKNNLLTLQLKEV